MAGSVRSASTPRPGPMSHSGHRCPSQDATATGDPTMSVTPPHTTLDAPPEPPPDSPAATATATAAATAAATATQVFVDHRELLSSIVYNMLGSVADTEDVLQE